MKPRTGLQDDPTRRLLASLARPLAPEGEPPREEVAPAPSPAPPAHPRRPSPVRRRRPSVDPARRGSDEPRALDSPEASAGSGPGARRPAAKVLVRAEIDARLARKLRSIAHFAPKDVTLTTIIEDALRRYVEDHEAEHGPVAETTRPYRLGRPRKHPL